MLTRALTLVLVLVVATAAKPALACGAWSLHDFERKVDVTFLIHRAYVTPPGDNDRGRILWVEHETDASKIESRDAATGKPLPAFPGNAALEYHFDKERVLKGDAVVGAGDDAGVSLGAGAAAGAAAERFTFVMNEAPDTFALAAEKDERHGYWHVVVNRGDAKVLEGGARFLCAGGDDEAPVAKDAQRETIKRRIVMYLAWRAEHAPSRPIAKPTRR